MLIRLPQRLRAQWQDSRWAFCLHWVCPLLGHRLVQMDDGWWCARCMTLIRGED